MQKTFILDTNVLLHNPNALFSFKDNIIVLPIEVIEELDEFKKDTDEKGRNARLAIRTLDELRSRGKLGTGVPLPEEGELLIPTRVDFKKAGKLGLSMDIVDNRILVTAYLLQKDGKEVIFVSKDINARVKADAIGLRAMDFEKQKVDLNKLYTGWRELTVGAGKIEEFYSKKCLKPETVILCRMSLFFLRVKLALRRQRLQDIKKTMEYSCL